MLSVIVGLPNFFVADFFGRRLCLDYPPPRFIHDENVVWKTLQRPIRFLGFSEKSPCHTRALVVLRGGRHS